MKTNSLKTALLSVCLMGGVSASWAEGTISIPQDLGSYIPIGTITNTSGTETKTAATGVTLQKDDNIDGSNRTENTTVTSYTIGNTNDGTPVYTFSLTVSEAADFLFSFKSGHSQGSAEISLVLKNSSDEVVWNNGGNNVAIPQTSGSWTPATLHAFDVGTLAPGTYTMTLTGVSKSSGNYYGNYGNFSFHTPAQYTNNWNNTTDVNFADAFLSGLTLDGTYLTKVDAGDYAEYYSYVPNTACYNLYCGIGYSTSGTDNYTITITDVATGTAEVDAVNYTVVSSHLYKMTSVIEEGWKKIRLAFPNQPNQGSCRVESVKYYAFDQLPLMGAGGVNTYLALNGGTYGRTATAKYVHDPSYESGNNNIGYNGDGGYAEFYVGNTNETAYYDFHIGTRRYQNDATFTLTITDVATSTVEVNQSGLVVPSGDSYADQTYKLTTAITPGLKKIRIETASASNSYAFNYKNITFYKRSLNENYDYTPVAATGVDVVLTRKITAGNWSTIVLPFVMTAAQLKEAFGDDVKVAELTSGDATTLNFTVLDLTDGATTTTANQPYAIKVGTTVSEAKTISGVTIVEGTTTQSLTDWDFVGTYESGNIPDGSYFFSGNKLWQASGDAVTIKPFRAYFTPKVAAARQVLFVIEGEEGETSIGRINADGTMETMAEGPIFNLAGQRVANPSKGLYIVNGKKVIIK